MVRSSKQLRQLVPGTAHFLLGRTFRRLYAAIVGETKKDARRSNGFPPPAPPGNRGRSSAIPARPSATVAESLATARFTKALELKKRRSGACCPRVVALVQLHPPKPPPRPPGGSHCLGYHIWGGLVGDRGHRKRKRKGQLPNCVC